MSKNIVYDKADQIPAAPTVGPNDPVQSGDPVLVGQLPGVALTDAEDTIGNGGAATVKTNGAADLAVVGQDGVGPAALSPGAIVYMQADGSLDGDDTAGVRFGYLLEAVGSGQTETVEVKVGY